MILKTVESLELRGLANRIKKDGGVYYLLNCEEADGTPCSLYCPDASAFPPGLKKGDMIHVHFGVKRYKNQESLIVVKVDKEA